MEVNYKRKSRTMLLCRWSALLAPNGQMLRSFGAPRTKFFETNLLIENKVIYLINFVRNPLFSLNLIPDNKSIIEFQHKREEIL